MGCCAGADPRFFLGGGVLVSFSTSTLINHIVFFFFSQNTSCIGKPQVISGRWGHTPCTLSLDPPLLHKILTWATVLYIHGQVSVEMHKIPVKKIVNYLTSTWLTLSLVSRVCSLGILSYGSTLWWQYSEIFCILKPSYFALFVKVYKVLIKLPDGRSYFIFRRYNEFHQLCDKVPNPD